MEKKVMVVGDTGSAMTDMLDTMRDDSIVVDSDYDGLLPTDISPVESMQEDMIGEGYDTPINTELLMTTASAAVIPKMLSKHLPMPSETDSITAYSGKVINALDKVYLNESNVVTNFLETMYDPELKILKEFGIEYELKNPGEFYLSDIINVLKEAYAKAGEEKHIYEGDLWIMIYKNIGASTKPYKEVCEKGGKYPIKLTLLDSRYAFKVKGDIQFNGFGFLSIIATYLSNPFDSNPTNTSYVNSAVIEMARWLDERALWNEVTKPIFAAPSISLHSKLQLFARIKDSDGVPNMKILKQIVEEYLPEIR